MRRVTAASIPVTAAAGAAAAAAAAGDPNVPAGEVTWTAAAAPLSTPWPREEQLLLQRRPQLVAMTAATAAHLAGGTRHS